MDHGAALAMTLAATDAVVIEFDAAGTVLSCLTGYERRLFRSRERLVGHPFAEAVGAAAAAPVLEAIAAALAGGEERVLECAGLDPAAARHFLCRVAAAAEPGRAVAVFRDVTMRTSADRALRESASRWRCVAEMDVDVVASAIVRPDGGFDIEWWKGNLLLDLGYSPAELDSFAKWMALAHPADHAAMRAFAGRIMDGVPAACEFRVLGRDGRTVWVLDDVTTERLPDGRLRMISILRDITVRKQAEESLRESEERYRLLAETLPDALVVHADGRALWANEACARLFKVPGPAAIVGQAVYEHVDPAQLASIRGRIATYLEHGLPAPPAEIRFRRPDGETLHAEITSTPVAWRGQPAVQTVLHDVTTRARTEQALREARDAAERAAETKGRFLSNMSHEIRTPLNGMLGMARLLRASGLDDGQRRYLDLLLASGELLASLVNDVLDLARLESGRRELRRVPLAAGTLVEAVAQGLSFAAEERGLALGVEFPDGDPGIVLGDPLALQQILINLVGNALKFTARGSVTVRAARDGSQDPPLLRFEVEDTGIGIPAAALSTIFDRFTLLDDAYGKERSGSGLGLAIVRELVELLGGRLDVASEPGHGSRFTVLLPAERPPDPPPAPAAADALPAAARRGARILAVEDNRINMLFLQTFLAGLGYSVDTAFNGDEALARMRGEPRGYDLVLLDIQLPGRDGLSVLAEMRADEARGAARTPAVALTGFALATDVARIRAAGFDDVLTKPVDEQLLAAAIVRLLDR